MNKQINALGVAIAATLGATAADATTYTAVLKSDITYSANGTSAGNVNSSTATWSYDDVTGLLSQTGGTFNVRFTTSPTTTLFRHTTTGLVIGNGAAASASTYTCLEGNFAGTSNASLCGNYNFGANYTNESTATWGPGTATARTVAGDDAVLGPMQDITAYNGFTFTSWIGTTLILENKFCNPAAPGGFANCSTLAVPYNGGYTWTLDAGPQAGVPVPAAVWLFGSALGLLGAVRRRAKA